MAQLESGLVLGIRDYFLKQNLPPGAVIGLSGRHRLGGHRPPRR